MTLTDPGECAFPPHPGTAGWAYGPDGEEWRGSLLARVGDWRRGSPLARSVPLSAPVVWTAAEAMHACHVSAWWPGLATTALMGAGGWLGARHFAADADRLSGGEAAAALGAAGGWLTAATAAGPLAGGLPWWYTIAGAGLTAAMWTWFGLHRGIRNRLAAQAAAEEEAAALESEKRWWNSEIGPLLGLHDWYLLKPPARTLLGKELLVGTSPHGKTAREVYAARTRLTDKLLAYLGLDFGQVDFEIIGPARLRIRIRYGDPWAEPIWHPVLRPGSGYAELCPEQATCTEPLCIGADPETGAPLQVALWDRTGAKVVAVFAKKEAGKTTLLDSLKERITACDDARLLQINLSKALEDSWWAELADASALDLDIGRAFGILRFVSDGITERPRAGRRNKVHRPTPARPLYVVTVDEIDAAIERDPVRAQRLLGLIAGKCRSEGFALVLLGQRGIQAAIGGGTVQMNIDIVIWGKFAKLSELINIFGRDAQPPDMGEYGGGNPGVFGVTSLPFLGEYQRGRAFYWGETDDGHRTVIAARRKRRAALPGLEPALARLAGQWDRIRAAGEYDWRADPEYEESGDAPGDLVETASGEQLPGVQGIRERISRALAAADDNPELTPLDEAGEARLQALVEADRQQWLAEYTAVDIRPDDLRTIMYLLAKGPTTSGEVAAAIGKSRETAHKYLTKLEAQGHAESFGKGRGAGFRLLRHLRVVGDGSDPE